MKKMENQPYPLAEELVNSISHGIGVIFGIVALILMLIKASEVNHWEYYLSAISFGSAIIILYLNSTFYHSFPWPKVKYVFKIFDHISIYLLIASTYTPFALITLKGETGHWVLGIVWTVSLLGIIFKIFFTGKMKILSTIMYILLGWMAIFVIKPLKIHLDHTGFMLVVVGGIVYTIGALFYSIKKIPFNHGIWHIFVLVGTFCHFWAIYYYVL